MRPPCRSARLPARVRTTSLPRAIDDPCDGRSLDETKPSSKSRVREIRERARRYQARAEEMRGSHGSVDVLYVIADRDSEIGGGLMAGALAYRIFIWMLPFALVLIGGIGVAASVSESPSAAVRSLGMTGIVASSVAEASRESSRWYALIIGIPVLAYATRVAPAQQRARIVAGLLPLNFKAPRLGAQSRVWFNADLRSRNYFIPGVVTNIIMVVTVILTAMAIVREKEIGTMEQLMVTPIQPLELMIGKMLPFAVVGLVDVLLVTAGA